MTRGSAAQEPSMDEILASIRRIIESGDERTEGSPASTARTKPERSAVVERLERLEGANVVARLSPETDTAFLPGDEDDLAAHLRHEMEADGAMQAAGGTQEEASGMKMQDPFQAGGEAGTDAPSPGARPGPETAFDVPSPTFETNADDRPAAVESASLSGPVAPTEPDTATSKPDVEEDRAAEAPFVAANSDSRRMQGFRAAVLDDLAEGGQLEGGAALVSGRTGELVGASFDELARAIREGELRSLEDMAQELLRPMLQDWLDDNLPKLVERLVREEIERVARGGRR